MEVVTLWWHFEPTGGALYGLQSYHVQALEVLPQWQMKREKRHRSPTSSPIVAVGAAEQGWPSGCCSLGCCYFPAGGPIPKLWCFLQSVDNHRKKKRFGLLSKIPNYSRKKLKTNKINRGKVFGEIKSQGAKWMLGNLICFVSVTDKLANKSVKKREITRVSRHKQTRGSKRFKKKKRKSIGTKLTWK